jgi:protease I
VWQLGFAGVALALVAAGLVLAGKWGRKPEIPKASTEPAVNVPVLGTKTPPRVIMLLPSFAFWNPDYEPVRKVLEAEGCRVFTAAAKDMARPDPSGGGVPVRVDYLLNNLKADDWEAVVFVGGTGVSEWWNPRVNEAAIAPFVNEMLAKNRVVSAICMAPAVLAHAHFLDGRRATMRDDDTISREMRNKLREVNWENRDVVIDGPFVTGRNAAAGRPFALAVVAELRKKSKQ